MPFTFEYSAQLQKYSNGFKLSFIIPKQYFKDSQTQTFENFLNIIETKEETKELFKLIDESKINDSPITIDYLRKLKVDKTNDESYFMTLKHYIIQAYKHFYRNYKQLEIIDKRLNGEDIYSQFVKRHMDDKLVLLKDELIKLYKSELEYDFKDLVNFNDYNESNINNLHTNILLALQPHEIDYSGICFEINNTKTKSELIEDYIYYVYKNNKISKRIIKKPKQQKNKIENSEKEETEEIKTNNTRKFKRNQKQSFRKNNFERQRKFKRQHK